MEDFMIAYNFKEILHVEADNMLYGNITSLLPVLRTGYKGGNTYIHSYSTYIPTYIHTCIHIGPPVINVYIHTYMNTNI